MQLFDISGFKLPEEDICHHGIKGQKWGVRRYQNPDGSLTELGKKRLKSNLAKYAIRIKDKKIGNTDAKEYEWYDGGKRVAKLSTFDWWDGLNIEDLEVSKDYRGKRLSYELLDFAVNELGAKNLAVEKDNHIAKHVYDKYGFKVTETDDKYYYMSV